MDEKWKNVKISVILPFYNARDTLRDSIKSIAVQTCSDFECLLVDNNSDDGSPDIARKWCHKDERFRLFKEDRQGVVFAFRKGWDNASGKYIARMDADDTSHPERLAKQSGYLDHHAEYGAVGSLVKYVSSSFIGQGFSRYVKWNNSVITYEEILVNRFIDAPIVNPTAMWKKEVGQRYGIYRHGDFPEDYEMWLRWLNAGVRICKLPACLLDWQDSPNRLTRIHPSYSDKAFYRIKSMYLVRWLEVNNPFHPRVIIWGASRTSRNRARILESHGLEITAYVDIKKTRQIDRKVLYYKHLPEPGEHFVLVYIRQWHAKEKIKHFLSQKGYREGMDFLFVS